MTRIVSILIVSSIALLQSCASPSEAQRDVNSNNVASGDVSVLANEALIVINLVASPHRDLKSLLEIPPPEIEFVFGCSNSEYFSKQCEPKHSTKIPSHLRPDAEAYWRESLRFRYKYLVEKFPDAKAEVEASVSFANLTQEFEARLRGASIDTDRGQRPISPREAAEVVRLLNTKAAELILQPIASDGNTHSVGLN